MHKLTLHFGTIMTTNTYKKELGEVSARKKSSKRRSNNNDAHMPEGRRIDTRTKSIAALKRARMSPQSVFKIIKQSDRH